MDMIALLRGAWNEKMEVAGQMKRRLFLTGPSGCGKSTMICRALGEDIHRAGGFITTRDIDENGTIRAFEIGSSDGYGQRERFLDLSQGLPRMDLEAFSGLGACCLERAGERNFSVLDELGGVELLDEDFVDALTAYLRGDQPCIGVMKGPGPAGKLVEMMGLSARYELARRAMYDYLKHDCNTLLLETTGWQDGAAQEAVQAWVQEYVR